jgi:hypothetical protein
MLNYSNPHLKSVNESDHHRQRCKQDSAHCASYVHRTANAASLRSDIRCTRSVPGRSCCPAADVGSARQRLQSRRRVERCNRRRWCRADTLCAPMTVGYPVVCGERRLSKGTVLLLLVVLAILAILAGGDRVFGIGEDIVPCKGEGSCRLLHGDLMTSAVYNGKCPPALSVRDTGEIACVIVPWCRRSFSEATDTAKSCVLDGDCDDTESIGITKVS